jgi:hypothetical protein
MQGKGEGGASSYSYMNLIGSSTTISTRSTQPTVTKKAEKIPVTSSYKNIFGSPRSHTEYLTQEQVQEKYNIFVPADKPWSHLSISNDILKNSKWFPVAWFPLVKLIPQQITVYFKNDSNENNWHRYPINKYDWHLTSPKTWAITGFLIAGGIGVYKWLRKK